MATSKELTKACAYGSVTLIVVRTGYDTSKNESYWKATLSTKCTGTIRATANKPYSFKVNGTEYSGTFVFGSPFTGTKTIRTVEKITIPHNADGTKSFDISFSVSPQITYSGKWVDPVETGTTVTADSILKLGKVIFKNAAANYTLSSSSVGASLKISVGDSTSEFYYKLTYTFGALSGDFSTEFIPATGSVEWIIPQDFLYQLSGTKGTMKATCETFDKTKTKSLGKKTVDFMVTVPSTAVPSITAVSISDHFSYITDRFGVYVQNHSKLLVKVTASASNGSAISKVEVTVESVKYTATSDNGETYSVVTRFLKSSGSVKVTIVVYDTRGITATTERTVTVVAYSPPYILPATKRAYRAIRTTNEYGEEVLDKEVQEGTFLVAGCSAFATALTDGSTHYQNWPNVVIEYKEVDSDTWEVLKEVDTDPTVQGIAENETFINVNYKDDTVNGRLDISTSYLVRFTVTDYLTQSNPPRVTIPVPCGFSIIDVNDTGKGVALFKMSEKDGFEVNSPSYFYGLIEKNGLKIPDIQASSATIPTENLKSENDVYYGGVEVKFDTPFKSKPEVFLTPWTGYPGSRVFATGVTNISTTGFTANVGRKDVYETSVSWIAVSKEEAE